MDLQLLICNECRVHKGLDSGYSRLLQEIFLHVESGEACP